LVESWFKIGGGRLHFDVIGEFMNSGSTGVSYQPSFPRVKRSQRGITMVEILVTLIILAIGFLGMASMQMVGAKNVAGSSYRTLATIYAYDMAERMRTNFAGIGTTAYNNIDGTNVTNPDCTNNCTPTQIARRDAYQWNQAIKSDLSAGGLPKGVGDVTYDAGDGMHKITVKWSETLRSDDSEATEQLQEFELAVKLVHDP